MEILAPAGSLQQAIDAIDAGCDAVYGGLKRWNARNRALNFTLEDYVAALQKCHQKSCKFYLTINTLLRDQELQDVLDLFHDHAFPHPDAVIVADLGLLISLRREFPRLIIHVSTQFGAYTAADLCLLKEMAADRVILPRELKVSEIDNCCKATKAEIEVFIYGSQCISFSGQCLMGGMIAGGSGNRGRCIGLCRDIYEDLRSKRIGQFLYPQDIQAYRRIKALNDIGVCSLKIEGRMRGSKEIKNAILNCKNGRNVDSDNCGFMSESLSEVQMINAVNPRTSFCWLPTDSLDCHDMIVDNNSFLYYDRKRAQSRIQFVKSSFSNPLSDEKSNIGIRIIDSEGHITKLDYINEYGERTVFSLTPMELQTMTVEQLYNYLLKLVNANIYEFSSRLPSKTLITVNKNDILKIAGTINTSLTKYTKPVSKGNSEHSYILQTSIAAKALQHLKRPGQRVIFNMYCLEEVQKVLNNEGLLDRIVFRLPLFEFTEQFHQMMQLIRNRQVMITKVSQIAYIQQFSFQSVIADYTVNCWNKESLSFLINAGIKGMVLTPELSLEDNMSIVGDSSMEIFCIKYGQVTLGYSRVCFKHSQLCGCDRSERKLKMVNLSKRFPVEIICHKDLDMREIRNGRKSFCPYNIKNIKKNINWICIEEMPNNDLTNCSLIYDRSVK